MGSTDPFIDPDQAYKSKMKVGQVLQYWGNEVGTRNRQNGRIKGLGMAGFKNPAIAPLFITMTGGMIFVIAYCVRSLTRNSDVSWQKVETPQKNHGTTIQNDESKRN